MQVSLKDVSTRSEGRLAFEYSIELKDEEINFEFPFPEPVLARGYVSDEAGVFSLYAELEATAYLRCARCNRPVKQDKHVEVSVVFTQDPEEEDEDVIYVDSDLVELDDILVPELILSMDMAVLCSPDCKGLCPKCGKDLNDGPCGCGKAEVDPRLAKLGELLK